MPIVRERHGFHRRLALNLCKTGEMVNELVRVLIEWVPAGAGGRMHPPAGPRYSTPARFEDDMENWAKGIAWSLVLEFDEPADNPLVRTATAWFLSPDAPRHLLRPG